MLYIDSNISKLQMQMQKNTCKIRFTKDFRNYLFLKLIHPANSQMFETVRREKFSKMFCSIFRFELAYFLPSLAELTPSEVQVRLRCKQGITSYLKATRRSWSWLGPLPPCFLYWLGMCITLGRGQGGSQVKEGLVGCHPALWLMILSRAWPQT